MMKPSLYRLEPVSSSPWLLLWAKSFSAYNNFKIYRGLPVQRGGLSGLNESRRILWGECFHSLLLKWLQNFIFKLEKMYFWIVFFVFQLLPPIPEPCTSSRNETGEGSMLGERAGFLTASPWSIQRAFLLLSAFFWFWKPVPTWPIEQLSQRPFSQLCSVLSCLLPLSTDR